MSTDCGKRNDLVYWLDCYIAPLASDKQIAKLIASNGVYKMMSKNVTKWEIPRTDVYDVTLFRN
jgi:hypothetical protein